MKVSYTSWFGLLGSLLVCVPAALSGQQAPPLVCQTQEEFRQFDFWVGEWDVVVNDSTRSTAGTNSIQPLHNGCVLEENWTSAGGGTGSSMNFYDSTTGKWRQVWLASNYMIEVEGGLDESGSMVLEGELRNFVQKSVAPFRGTWTPIEDGVVRQFFEIQTPGTETWAPWFDGLYLRKGG